MSVSCESELFYRGMNLDLALGTAGARIAELLRRQSDNWQESSLCCPDETMLGHLTEIAGTRLNPEQYHNDRPVDDEVVFNVAVNSGFVRPEIYEASNETELALGIHSDPEPCIDEVEAIIVPGAAGLSNLKRLYHAKKAVDSGAVKTRRIIIASGQRRTDANERAKILAAGFMPGDTEYECCKNAVEALYDISPQEIGSIPVAYGEHECIAHVAKAIVDKKLKIEVVESPYDPQRRLSNGKLATRANTEETLIPIRRMLSDEGVLYIVSHDIWQPVQEVIAYRIFLGHPIFGSAAQNLDRVIKDSQTGRLRLNAAASVQDEMKKYLQELAKIHPLTNGNRED